MTVDNDSLWNCHIIVLSATVMVKCYKLSQVFSAQCHQLATIPLDWQHVAWWKSEQMVKSRVKVKLECNVDQGSKIQLDPFNHFDMDHKCDRQAELH